MSNILYVSIDVSSLTNVVYIMLPNGREYTSFSVDNSLYSAKYIVKASIKALKAKKLKEIHFGLEATSIYGKNLIYYLNDDES